VTRGATVFIRVVTVYVKNDTFFNAPKASWLRWPSTRGGAVDFLRFSRPSRTVFGGGSLHDKHGERGVYRWQNHCQNVLFIVAKLMEVYVKAEYHTSEGRIYLRLPTDACTYVMEFNPDGTAEDALARINDKVLNVIVEAMRR
jgi:hypothetical protein